MNKILIGRYISGDSLVYKMDPRGKLLTTICFILLIFLANNPVTYIIVTLFSILAVAATGLKPKVFWDGVKPMIWLILFTSFLQLFFTVGGKVYWRWGIFAISTYGITNTVFIFIRFTVPTLFDETYKIMNAQRSRGADFNNGGLIQRAKAITPLLVPLFISSLETAIDLSTAMESRGYRGDEGRTKFRVLKWSKYDLVNLGYFVVLTALLLIFRTH